MAQHVLSSTSLPRCTSAAGCRPTFPALGATQKARGVRISYRRHSRVHAEEPSGPLGSGALGAPGAEPDKVPEWEFDEGAAQVQRLLQRDRKELTGVEEIGAGFSAEFDDGKESEAEARGGGTASANGASPSSSASASPFGTGAPAKPMSPFGAAALGSSSGGFGAAPGKGASSPGGPANPFSGARGAKLFTENAQLSPTMEPDSFEEKPWWQTITFGQIVLVISFTTIIGLMVATFFVVLRAGGVHFNE